MDIDMEKLHGVQLEILDYVYSVCEENNLTCYLAYGTALGAYRYQGFIPWDDDVDVAMPREDYMKFLSIMKKNKDENFEIQDEDNEKRYFLSYAKVRKKNTALVERLTQGLYTHNGIFIDVFPLDYIRSVLTFTYKVRYNCIRYLVHILKFDTCKELYRKKEDKKKYVLDSIASYPASLLPRRVILKILNKLKAGNTLREEAVCVAEFDAPRLVMPYFFYFPPRKTMFEGRMYNVPNELDEYLGFIYGNGYLFPPPEQCRKSEKILEIEIETEENRFRIEG